MAAKTVCEIPTVVGGGVSLTGTNIAFVDHILLGPTEYCAIRTRSDLARNHGYVPENPFIVCISAYG